MDDRLTLARTRYEQAVFGGDPAGLVEAERALDGLEADLALARGRLLHAALLAGSDLTVEDADREPCSSGRRSCTGPWATSAARRKRCSGSGCSTRWRPTITRPRARTWNAPWSWPGRPMTI